MVPVIIKISPYEETFACMLAHANEHTDTHLYKLDLMKKKLTLRASKIAFLPGVAMATLINNGYFFAAVNIFLAAETGQKRKRQVVSMQKNYLETGLLFIASEI